MALALGAPALAACASHHRTADSTAELAAGVATTAQAAAVEVVAGGCGPQPAHGSGTVIDDGLVVTAAHVVAGATEIEVRAADGTAATTEVVYFDPRLDVAALRSASPIGTPAPLHRGPVDAAEVGVIAVAERTDQGSGSAIVRTVDVVRPVTIRTTDIYLDARVERPGYEIQAPIAAGDSGAMVHLTDGGIGIVWARSTEREGRAWVVSTPDVLTDEARRDALSDAVDVGPCP